MERLWAPWRHAYVTSASDETNGCIFCEAFQGGVRLPPSREASADRRSSGGGGQGDPSRDELLIIRGRVSFVILNLYPYNSGHLMVVPNRHVATLASTTSEEQAELMRFTRHAEIALTEAYVPQGINIGVNLGRPAGAGVLDHLHVHLVPRWSGDTNFMTVVGNVRVMPEDLRETAKRLRPIFERLSRDDV